MRASRLAARLAPLALLLLPIAFFANHLFPDAQGRYAAIGNDFGVLYHSYKLYYVSALAEGHVPLWSPSEGGGYPFFFSPFPATLYPLNVLPLLHYALVGSYSALAHQWFAVLGVSLFALGLERWLRSLGVAAAPAFLVACVFACDLKLCELLRFPNAVHAAAWIPWVLYGTTRCFLRDTHRLDWLGKPGILAFAGFSLLTAGYPYYAYYAAFLFLPYLALLVIPAARRTLFPGLELSLRTGLLRIAAASALTLTLCVPYLVQMARLMAQTTDRAGSSFAYSTAELFNQWDVLGALVFPPASQTEGVYYFSTALLLLLLFELLRRPSRQQAILLAWWATITYITFGRESLLFRALWAWLPGFSHLRVWGRMNVLLLPLLAWLSALCLNRLSDDWRSGAWRMPRGRMLVWAVLSGAVFATQLVLLRWRLFDEYWTRYMADLAARPLGETHALVALVVAAGGLVAAKLAYEAAARVRSASPAWLAGALCLVAIADLHVEGPWMWSHTSTPDSRGEDRMRHDVRWEVPNPTRVPPLAEGRPFHTAMMASFKVRRIPGSTATNSSRFSVGRLDNWFFERFNRFIRDAQAGEKPSAVGLFLGLRTGQKLFCAARIDHDHVAELIEDARQCRASLQVLAYDGDQLELQVDSERPVFVVFVDNWDPVWRGYQDGIAIPVRRVFGTFKAVTAGAGSHRIRFAYEPFAF